MKNLIFLAMILIVFSCSPTTKSEESTDETSNDAATEQRMQIGDEMYVTQHQQMIEYLSAMDFDSWGAMMSDSVRYHFPDGNSETRTILEGKEATLAWWNNWKETSGVNSMSFDNGNYFPVKVPDSEDGPGGNIVFSFLDTNLQFSNGNTADIRMAFSSAWNSDNKITAIYTYYDRTPIIKAMGGNILSEKPAE